MTAPENVPVVPETAPENVPVVPEIAAGVDPPITAPSIEPPLMSAVVAVRELNVPAAGVVPPITVLSTVPALMSAVVAVSELNVPAPADEPPMVTPSIVPPSMLVVTLPPEKSTVPVAVIPSNVAVPVNVGPARSDLVDTAVAIALNSVSNSEPRITLLVSPVGKESLAVKFVDFT